MGVFLSSLDASMPGMSAAGVPDSVHAAPVRARDVARQMGTRSLGLAKNFGTVGFIFAGTECAIESVKKNFYILFGFTDTPSF